MTGVDEPVSTFPNAGADMGDSRFTNGDLAWTEDFLVGNIQINDPAWVQKPKGPLGARWLRVSSYNASFLIHVALTLKALLLGLDLQSHSLVIFQSKFKSLLRAASEKQFEELLTELEAGVIILDSMSPVTLEPLAGADADGKNRLRSPDYSVELPEGHVYIEVTQASFGFMDDWTAAAKIAEDRMRARSRRRRLNRFVEFAAPILATADQMGRLSHPDVLDAMTAHQAGEMSIRLRSGIARVRWRPVPTRGELEQRELEEGQRERGIRFSISDDEAVTYNFIFGISYRALIDADIEEKILRSLRNTLDDKRGQLTIDAPYVLFIRIDQVELRAIVDLVLRRIFPNPDYVKFTAIVIFRPARSWKPGEEYGEEIQVAFNERAAHPATQSLRDALLNRAKFRSGVRD